VALWCLPVDAWAQSKDVDNPTPLTNTTIKGDLPGAEGNQYYSFNAGPGNVTITAFVESAGIGVGVVGVQLFSSNLSTQLCSSETEAINGGTQSGTCSASLKAQERVIMRVGLMRGCKGCTYRVRVDGARGADGPALPAAKPTSGAAPQSATAPASGAGFRTMLIRLKDGTTMQIDLAKVADITYK
jgi:hypothetical protein